MINFNQNDEAQQQKSFRELLTWPFEKMTEYIHQVRADYSQRANEQLKRQVAGEVFITDRALVRSLVDGTTAIENVVALVVHGVIVDYVRATHDVDPEGYLFTNGVDRLVEKMQVIRKQEYLQTMMEGK